MNNQVLSLVNTKFETKVSRRRTLDIALQVFNQTSYYWYQGDYWRYKLPVQRNTTPSKIGNDVIT